MGGRPLEWKSVKKPLKGSLVTLDVMVLRPGLLWLDAIRC